MSQSDMSPGCTGGICAQCPLNEILLRLVCPDLWPVPNSFCKRLLLSRLRMFPTRICQLWHKNNNNKEGLWLSPVTILSNSSKCPTTAFGKVLGKAWVYVLPCFPKVHLLTLLLDKGLSFIFFCAFWQQKMLTAHEEAPGTCLAVRPPPLPRSETSQDWSPVCPHILAPTLPFSMRQVGCSHYHPEPQTTHILLITSYGRPVFYGCL